MLYFYVIQNMTRGKGRVMRPVLRSMAHHLAIDTAHLDE